MASQFYRDVIACLRRMGFVRIIESQSVEYYQHEQFNVVVRVGDHDLPETPETGEQHNGSRFLHGWNVLTGDRFSQCSAARELVRVRRDVRRKILCMS
jgi:hypothetical protein